MPASKHPFTAESMSYRTSCPNADRDARPRETAHGAAGDSKAPPTNRCADLDQSVNLAGTVVTIAGPLERVAARLDHEAAAVVLATFYVAVAEGAAQLVEPARAPRSPELVHLASVEQAARDLADIVSSFTAVAQPNGKWTDAELEGLKYMRSSLEAFCKVVPL